MPSQVVQRKDESSAVPFMGDAVYQLRFSQEGKTIFEMPWVPEEPLVTLKPGQKRSERMRVFLPKDFPVKPMRLSAALRELRQGLLRPDNADVEEEFLCRAGEWQELSLSYQSKEGEEIGLFAVEKGRTAPSTLNAEIRSWTVEARPLATLE